jgi:hypothetical protein
MAFFESGRDDQTVGVGSRMITCWRNQLLSLDPDWLVHEINAQTADYTADIERILKGLCRQSELGGCEPDFG